MDKFNKDFKKDWQQASQEDKRHIVKMIILLAGLTLVPVLAIIYAMATGII